MTTHKNYKKMINQTLQETYEVSKKINYKNQ